MAHKVEIDDEVFTHLQQQARPLVDSVNDVLRRLLLPKGAVPKTKEAQRRPGNLMRLLDGGLVQARDRLTHTRKRSGQTYHAIITADGWTELPDGQAFRGPSPALKEYVGTQIDGNANWTHDASGKTLRQLIAALPK